MGFTFLFLPAIPSLLVMLAARYLAARALGMKGVRFFLAGRVEDPARATPLRRAAVVLVAVGASYLAVALVGVAANLVRGTPVITNEIVVIPGKPADAAGLRSGDRVTSVAGKPTAQWSELAAAINARAGEPTEIVASRGGEELRVTVTPIADGGKGKIGIAAAPPRHDPMSAGAALAAGLALPAMVMRDAAVGFASLIKGTGAGQAELQGPVGIVAETSRAASAHAGDALYMIAAWLAFVWPITAILAIIGVPRPRKIG
jgi:membrane-associated protease RseP (regulator of RpoE activity)